MLRTTEGCVRGDLQRLVAFSEHCTQAQDQNRVNGECVPQMLLQQEPLQDEPGADMSFSKQVLIKLTYKLSSSHQMMMQMVMRTSTAVLTSGSGTPFRYLNITPRPSNAFIRVHQTKAANPFWV